MPKIGFQNIVFGIIEKSILEKLRYQILALYLKSEEALGNRSIAGNGYDSISWTEIKYFQRGIGKLGEMTF